MACVSPAPPQNTQTALLHACLLITIAVLATADSSETGDHSGNLAENRIFCNESQSDLYHCPQGWILFMNHCFKVTEAALTWTQAQALCRSYGGNLVKIASQCEQDWLSQFVREQLKNVSLGNKHNKTPGSDVADDVTSIEAWIGFVRLVNRTFQWSDGQPGVEQDGFWAVDGFNNLDDKSASKLCCDLKAQSPSSDDLRWQLASCDELHSSVCELRPCEEHTQHCGDGSRCINKAWTCDGYWDCQDGSDENDCYSTMSTTASSRCGAVFKEPTGWFVSPNFPERYPPFLNCLWRIESTSPQVIDILVSSLDTEDKYDTLSFYEGTDVSDQQLIVSFGGKMSNQSVKSQGSFVTIHFVSDYSTQANGFNITWRAGLETEQCGGQLTAGDEELVLSFPQSQHDTSTWSRQKVFNCDWLISSFSRTSHLSLQFQSITLMAADSITVYDGRAADAPVITHITSATGSPTPSSQQDFIEAAHTYSANIPPVITSSGQHLLLHVIISRDSLSGFVVAYKNGCDTFISSSSSLILSPGYPKLQYPNDLNCTWTVSSDEQRRRHTLLFLPLFNTELVKDYVQVFNSESRQHDVTNVTTISGQNSTLQSGISSFHGFVINFVTDSTVNHGLWAAVISYDCDVLSVLTPLLLNSTDVQFGGVVGYSCMKGFKLDGPSYAVCGLRGQWLPSDLPACSNINCGPIPVPSDAYLLNATGLTYGSQARYKCLPGHTLVDHNETTCGENGWENVPLCKLITCPKERPPSGGNARAEHISVGYQREFFCKPNLQLIGSKFSHCNISGQWSDKVPVCEAQKCPNLYGLLHSQRNVTEPVMTGKSVRFTCDEGYKLFGQDVLTCMDDLQFDYPLPSCIDVDECDNSEICGIHPCQNFIGGFSCYCQAGYKHLDNSSHFCSDINECESSNGGCSHTCLNLPGSFECGCPQNMNLYEGPLDQIQNTTLTPNKTCIASCKSFVATEAVKVLYQQKALNNGEFLYGSKADIICPHGSYSNGASVVSCLPGEGWSPPAVNCTELLCDAPGQISEGTVSYTNLALGSSVSYFCHKNVKLVGPRIRFCEKRWSNESQLVKPSWTGSQPTCANVTCPLLQSPAHGSVYLSSTVFNSVAVFRCECGYRLVGLSVAKCMKDGSWSHPSPTCEVQYCLHPGLPAQAKVLEYTPGFPVGSTVRFQCLNKGYQFSSQNSIKCLAYRQTKTSVVKPSIDLTVSGLFVSVDQVNVTACNVSNKAEKLADNWQKALLQLCDMLNVEVHVLGHTAGTLDEDTINITIQLILSSDNASTTCHCSQDIQSYLMASSNVITLASLDSHCLNLTLKPKTNLTTNGRWLCDSGLRLENGNQQCGQEMLPSCMEDCIDEKIETIDTAASTGATTEHDKDYESESTFWKQSTATESTTEQFLQDTTHRELSSFSTPVISTVSSSNFPTNGLDKPTAKLPSPTLTTVETASATRKNPTTPSLDSKQTSTDMWTNEQNSSKNQTRSSSKTSSTVNESTAKTTEKYSDQITHRDSTSVVSTLHNQTDYFHKTTKLYSSTFSTPRPSFITSSAPPNQDVFTPKQVSSNMWTPAQTSSMHQTDTPVGLSTSTLKTSSAARRNPTIPNQATSTSISTRTSSLTNTRQRPLPSTHPSLSTATTTKSTSASASNSKATDQSAIPSIHTTHPLATNHLTSTTLTTTRGYSINEWTFPWSKHQTVNPTSAATPLPQRTITEYPGASVSLGNSTTKSGFIQRTTNSPQSTLEYFTTNTDRHTSNDRDTSNDHHTSTDHHTSMYHHTSKDSHQETTSSWSEKGSERLKNSSPTVDYMTTPAGEKQTGTSVQDSPLPSHGLVVPVYAVEIYDDMWGWFSNISCIDAVHASINGKVIELLREFKEKMGKLACRDALDAALELTYGSIRYKGTKAKIFINISITYTASSPASIISCGLEFKSLATYQLPKMFEKVESELAPSQCQFINYTGQDFNVTFNGWKCQDGFLLDEDLLQCFNSPLMRSLQTDSSISAMTPSPPITVLTIPHLSMKFSGTFTSASPEDKIDENCGMDYKTALIKVLTTLEHDLQSLAFKDIYTSVDKDINVTINDIKVVVEVTVSLLPLQNSVDLLSLHKCANFTSLQFREPPQQILSVTVTKAHLSACPALVLSSHGFRTDITKMEVDCTSGYIKNLANFKCINELLPQYSVRTDIALTREHEESACGATIQALAQQLIQKLYAEIHKDVTKGSICNTSENVLLLQEQTDLLKEKQTNISITVIVVNLAGSKTKTFECAEQLNRYFKSTTFQKISLMIDALPEACQAGVTFPQNKTVTYQKWVCLEQRVYNSLTHQCLLGSTQAPKRRTSGQSFISRQKRSDGQLYLRPQWNETLPTCIDTEPPTFHPCVEGPQIISLGQLGSVPVLVCLPNVTDNSGMIPTVTVIPDVSLPYRFVQNTTVVMTARDRAGNIARFNLNVTVIDQISPVISCPTNVVTIYMETCQSNPTITYESAGVAHWDNSGSVNVVYDPPPGSEVKVSEVILVTATAVDNSANQANCSFIARVENCPQWSLALPKGGNKSCMSTGTDNQELSCVVSCPAGKGFAVQPPDRYVFSGQWLPHNRVPPCVESRFPDYEVHLKFDSQYQGNTTGDCLDEMLKLLIKSVRSIIEYTCRNATQELNFTQIDNVGTFPKDSFMMTAKLRIPIQLTVYSKEATAAAQWCGEAVLRQLDLNETLRGSCGQLRLDAPVASAGKTACPGGYAHLSGMCYECPAGSYLSKPTCGECPTGIYQNCSEQINCLGLGLDCPKGQCSTEPECLECPTGTYQNSSGSSECLQCKLGHNTSDVGTIDENDCLAECTENQFSFTGVKPCLPCPLGTHQPWPGSKHCNICDFGSEGRSEFPYCKKLCPSGTYNPDGVIPCTRCPLNYFSQLNGSKMCTECPDNFVTKTEGSVSFSQCEAYDPCLDNSCNHNGSYCRPHGRYFQCECQPGFTGVTCQEKVCDSQACQNNRTCQRDGNIITCSCQQESGSTYPHELTVIDYCLSNPCVYGSCTETSEGFSCLCSSGYHGERCDVKTDNCAAVTCRNGGTCVDLVTGFQCLCTEELTGIRCEVKIGHCQVNYCVNGGTCVDGADSFNCSCPEGFTGEFCEVDKNECDNSPCLNGGLCQDDINSFKCLCMPGYTGHWCESIMDPCDLQPCLNGAVCSKTNNSGLDYFCICTEGYTGKRCEADIDVCNPMPCSTDGSYSCEKAVSNFKCNCLPGWKGALCDEKADPCSIHPCINGGTCSNSSDSFICFCPAPFTGPTCSVSMNSCWSRPCQNLGSCVETTSGYLCQCLRGFTGLMCEHNIDECESSPCLNQGVCQDGVNSFTCSCPRGYAGDLCEVDIDECIGQPCKHNSSCRQLTGDFMCICSAGFTGEHCDTKIDVCNSNPCQHQGTCVDQAASFHCICPEGYFGAVCEETVDKCQNHTTCLNKGTCQNIDGKSVCRCNPRYKGDDCGKEKSANFDLLFLGGHSLTSQPSMIHIGNLSEFSLCLWVKFSTAEGQGTYLVMASEDGLNHFLTLRDSQAISPLFTSREITLNINDGQWHHFCLVLSLSRWTVFKDGINFQTGEMGKFIFGNSLILKLGQPLDPQGNNKWFRGHLHEVNIYSFALDTETILNMSQDCHYELQGNLFDWVTAEPHMFGDVQVNMPSQCGQTLCSAAKDNQFCTAIIDVDKTPPESVSCPGTIVVTRKKKFGSVTWEEPEFSDNKGIVSVKQNFRPGQIFPHGQYLVTYVAYDAEHNSANCSFNIFVRKLECVDPPPPTNGARTCRVWKHGRYCTPSCTKSFHFVTPTPLFYRCGYEGIWDPSGGDQFVFPICARAIQPSQKMFGSITFAGPDCSSTNKLRLKEKLMHTLTELLHLCDPNKVCNNTQDFNIECAVKSQRKRRAFSSERSMYTVGMNISVPSSLSEELLTPDALPDNVTYLMKQDQAEGDFVLASVDLQQASYCHAGQILINTDKYECLSCPAGYYQETETACSPCPRGWYNDKPQQIVCVQCANGLTTSLRGTTSSSQCSFTCRAGTYFSANTSGCEPCPVGEYQNMVGQWSCIACPMGLTTQFSGAVSGNYCQDLCGAGQELGANGICVDCPMGTYSDGKDDSRFCTPCPFGWTTEKEKAVNETQCTLRKCDKGYYHQLEGKTCAPCPRGTYQKLRGATSCEPCGVRQTTGQEGAGSRSLCISGQVNECELGIDSCPSGSKCVDSEDGFSCEYICENYCSTLKFCADGGSIQDKECHCAVDMCKNYNSKDSTYNSLVIASIIVTVIAVLVLLAVIIFCVYRRNHQMKQGKHVRMYRDETELASFTNEAFDSFSTHTEVDRNELPLHMPRKIATRWHNQNFRSKSPFTEDEVESEGL